VLSMVAVSSFSIDSVLTACLFADVGLSGGGNPTLCQSMTQKADMRGKEKLDDVMGQKFLLLRIFAHIVVQLNFTHRRVKCSYLPNHAASVLARSHPVGEPATSYKFRELIRPRPGLFWVRLEMYSVKGL